ncbi:hypothetical protein [Salinicoccus carnicancri]|uniref:hypothetical protein n=1 Tax=Salinicoccus carnicancri TaxID=558170 RepID=UPI00031AF87D|nr:hypothetical protein [Salinicoccus carnicancri]
MKAKFLIFASVFLCSCGQGEGQEIKQGSHKANPPALTTMDNYSLPTDTADSRETMSDSGHPELKTAGLDGKHAGTPMNASDGAGAADMEELASTVNGIQSDITAIWNNVFIPMYQQYNSDGISRDRVAGELETLHGEYDELEERVNNIKVADAFSPEHKEEMEEMKSDLALAISNRTLALIEFKLMNTSGDTRMHSELLEIHTENSRKYMSSAAIHMKTLEELPAEGNSASGGKPAATSR